MMDENHSIDTYTKAGGIRVYIAGPLFGSGRASENIYRAIKTAERIRAAGMMPFVPHLFFLWDTISPHDGYYWLGMDRSWLECCDAMIRLHGDSPGSTLEEAWCEELGIPVYHEGNGQRGVSALISAFAAEEVHPRNRP